MRYLHASSSAAGDAPRTVCHRLRSCTRDQRVLLGYAVHRARMTFAVSVISVPSQRQKACDRRTCRNGWGHPPTIVPTPFFSSHPKPRGDALVWPSGSDVVVVCRRATHSGAPPNLDSPAFAAGRKARIGICNSRHNARVRCRRHCTASRRWPTDAAAQCRAPRQQ